MLIKSNEVNIDGLETREAANNKVLLDYFEEYKKISKPIEVNFRELVPELRGTDRYTHLIHRYPAKLLAHIPSFFLNNSILSKPNEIPIPLISFNPKIPVRSSYLPPPPIEPI